MLSSLLNRPTSARLTPSPIRETRRAPLFLLVLALGASACGDDDKGTPSADAGTEGRIAVTTDASPATVTGSTGSDAGIADAGPARVPARPCESGSTEPCTTNFITTFGTSIPLGKYGAVMEYNVGAAFKTQVSPLDSNALCGAFAGLFGQDAAQANQLLDLRDLDLSLYTIYRPANFDSGEKFPIVTWGNGTCAQPEGYGALLRYVASQGFFVIAPNSRYASTGSTQVRALDFLFAANEDPTSPYYQKLDTTKVAAMGHSQGGQATVATANDPRVATVVLFNGGASPAKPYLTISGDRDIGGKVAADFKAEVDLAPKAAFLFFHMIPGTGSLDGHLTLMTQPERLTEPTVAWLKYLLQGDPESQAWFVGPTCKLCSTPDQYEYGAHGL